MTSNDTSPTISRSRQKLFAAISMTLGIALALMFAEWGLDFYFQRIQSQNMDPGLIRYHSQLGWSLSPGWSGQHTHYDYQSSYSIGSNGFREQTEAVTNEDTAQYAVLGDSFTFGLGVANDQTFVSQLNANGAGAFRNFGTPGTSTDQQLLLLRLILPDESLTGVVLVVYLANDLLDNTQAYPLQAEQAKPYFQIENGRLAAFNAPVPLTPKPALLRSTNLSSIVLDGFEVQSNALESTSLGRLVSNVVADRQYDMTELRPVLERNLAPAMELFEALLAEMARDTTEAGLSLTVALLPGRDAMVNPNGISHHFQEYLRESSATVLARRGIGVVDLMSQIALESDEDIQQMYFPNDGHLTPAGHRYVADKLAQAINR